MLNDDFDFTCSRIFGKNATVRIVVDYSFAPAVLLLALVSLLARRGAEADDDDEDARESK